MPSLHQLLQESRAPVTPPRLISIGECMVELRSDASGGAAVGFAGDTLNCATYVARIGDWRIKVDYATSLGDDSYSSRMLAAWKAERIGTSLVERLPGRLPGLYAIETDDKGERSFLYWRSAAAARDMLRGDRPAAIAAAIDENSLVYVSGITFGILDDAQRESLIGLLTETRKRGGAVAFDGNWRPRAWSDPADARRWFEAATRLASIALPTFDDEQALFGDADPAATAARLHGLGVPEAAIKLGEQGALVALAGAGTVPVGTNPTKVVDTTGAGDSFNGAYLASRLMGLKPGEAAAAGNRLAGIVVGYPGAIIPLGAMPV